MTYETDGFKVVEGLIADDLLLDFGIAFDSLVRHKLRGRKHTAPLIDGIRALDELDHDHVHQIHETLRHSSALGRILYDDEVLREVAALLATPMVYLLQHTCRIDPPGDTRVAYGWHQQSWYSVYRAAEVQLWAPVVRRNTREMGTMSIIPGSHRSGQIQHVVRPREGGADEMIVPDEQVDRSAEMFVEIAPGDAILFHPDLLHRSNPNQSEFYRYSIVCTYVDPFDPAFRLEDRQTMRQWHLDRCRAHAHA